MSIAKQFWNLKKEDDPVLDLEGFFEVVDKFPDNMYRHAGRLYCWAFIHGERRPTIVGFGPCHVKITVRKIYVITTEMGGIKEILTHDGARAYKLDPRHSASVAANMLRTLNNYYEYKIFDSRCLQYTVDKLLEPQNEDKGGSVDGQ